MAPTKPHICWSMDFMSDSLTNCRRFRTFNVIDDFNREILTIEIDRSLPSSRVIRTLLRLFETYGKPNSIRMDNGPEFTSMALKGFCKAHGVKLGLIQKGKPTHVAKQNYATK
jgi:putative transposase